MSKLRLVHEVEEVACVLCNDNCFLKLIWSFSQSKQTPQTPKQNLGIMLNKQELNKGYMMELPVPTINNNKLFINV